MVLFVSPIRPNTTQYELSCGTRENLLLHLRCLTRVDTDGISSHTQILHGRKQRPMSRFSQRNDIVLGLHHVE